MKLYNQNNYPDVPYNYIGGSGATIKSAGCGVCSMSTVLSWFNIDSPPPVMAEYSRLVGARINGGTDMRKLAKSSAEKYALAYSTANSEQELRDHIARGGIAIANVDGNEGTPGVFSNAGHYIVVCGVELGGRIRVYDVGDYAGKYEGKNAWRGEKAKRAGDYLLCNMELLNDETQGRDPNYYLFSKEVKNMTRDEAKQIVKEKAGLSDATLQYIVDDYRWGDDLIIKLAQAMK